MEVSSVLEYLETVSRILGESYTLENIRKVDADLGNGVPFRTNRDPVARAKARRAWYRGQPVGEDLVPKVFRRDANYDEKELFLEARRRAFVVSGTVPSYEAMDQWLFVMQHHGLATRLLDWTESPLIALYFAVSGDPGKMKFGPNVWMMNPHVMNWKCHRCSIIPTTDPADGVESWANGKLTEEKGYGFKRFAAIFRREYEKPMPMAIRPRTVDLRMSVQRSFFTIHGTDHRGANAQLANSDMASLGFLKKIEVRATQAESIRAQLLSFGVGHANLFPDLDGLFAEVNATQRTPVRGGAATDEADVGDTQATIGGSGSGVLADYVNGR